MTDNKIKREKIFSEELPYFKERIQEVLDNHDNLNGNEDPLYIDVLRHSKCIVRKAEEEINRQQAEYNNLLEQFRILDYECGRLEKADENQKAEIENLTYTLLGVMHSVDKWLDGTELEQDEVNRSATMREKTLRIVEEKQAEIERLQKEVNLVSIQFQDLQERYEESQAEIERFRKTEIEIDDFCRRLCRMRMLNGNAIASYEDLENYIQQEKSEAVKEFARRLKCGVPQETGVIRCSDVDNLVKEMVGDKE